MKLTSTLITWCLLSMHSLFGQTYPTFNITAYDPSQSTGYYFFCPYNLPSYPNYPPGTQHQMILDSAGNVVYYREIQGHFAGDFKLQPNGQITYCGISAFYIMDSTFTEVDSVTTGNGVYFDIHDLQILPNGNYLLLGFEDRFMDLSSYHIFNGNGTPGSTNALVRAFVVQELDTAKNVIFEFRSLDNFAFDDVDEYWLYDPASVDWTHSNSVEMDYDGNILVSSRHFDEITKINRSDSSVIWRFGGKRNQFTVIGDSMLFLSQHDARRLPNGNLTLFDNGRATTPLHYASSKEYVIDEINLTATLVWSHNEGTDHWSRSQGNTQRLANGNTLNSYGNLIPDPVVFNVTDSLDNKVFEVAFPDSLISYRSFNFPTLPWKLNRPVITCTISGNGSYLTVDSGYSSYMWSNGDTTQSILANDTGGYSVFVPYGAGGFISSEKFILTDTADPCGFIASVQNPAYIDFNLYPNPVSGFLNIKLKNNSANFEVYDLTGRVVRSGTFSNSELNRIDVRQLSDGLYIINVGGLKKKFVVRN